MGREPIPTWFFALAAVRREDRYLLVHGKKGVGSRFLMDPARPEQSDAWSISSPAGLSVVSMWLQCPACSPSARPKSSARLDELKDKRAQVRIAARLRLAEAGSLGDWHPVAGAVSEMRIHYGPGYRLYFTRRGSMIVVLLNGGDKSSQQRDIRRAVRVASEIGEDI